MQKCIRNVHMSQDNPKQVLENSLNYLKSYGDLLKCAFRNMISSYLKEDCIYLVQVKYWGWKDDIGARR